VVGVSFKWGIGRTLKGGHFRRLGNGMIPFDSNPNGTSSTRQKLDDRTAAVTTAVERRIIRL